MSVRHEEEQRERARRSGVVPIDETSTRSTISRPAAPRREAADEITVLTQNAWGVAALWPQRCELLARRVGELRPSVVGLQEILAPRSEPGAPSQAHEIAERVGGYRVFFAPGRVAASGACEGVALLIRDDVEVIAHSVEALTLDRDDPFEGDSQRIVLRAAVRAGGVLLDVFVTHLSLSRHARLRTVRELMAFTARERAASGSVGAVLMGDFNALPGEASVAALADAEDGPWLDVAQFEAPRGLGGTWPAPVPFRRIDYVFVQPADKWTEIACERVPWSGSDHLGVLARLRLPR